MTPKPIPELTEEEAAAELARLAKEIAEHDRRSEHKSPPPCGEVKAPPRSKALWVGGASENTRAIA